MKTDRRKNMLRFFFLHYAYVVELLHILVYLLPPFVRPLLYKLVFKKAGKRMYIDARCFFRYPNRVAIGSDVSINRGCQFYSSYMHKEAIIELGNNIRIGPEVKFFAAGHDYKYLNLPDTASKIEVKDNVWIGGGSIVLPGVTIGEGAIVAAGSIVTKSLEPYSVYAGAPAKKIKQRDIKDDQVQ